MARATWHGTWNGYANRRCRCEKCLEAGRAYQRERYQRSTPEPLYVALASRVEELGLAGYTRPQIAAELGVSLKTVDNARSHLGVNPPPVRRKHKRDGADDQIIALYQQGVPVEEVAGRTGVHVRTIYRALHDHGIPLRRDS